MVQLHGNAQVWPFIGFGAGLVFFYRGLRLYRETLLVADTPPTPIRSVAMGRVQVRGTARGEGAFPSPVSGTPCFAFQVQIERWTNRNWRHYRTDHNGVPFYLEDDSGRIRVTPREAEFDVPLNCRRQVGVSVTSAVPFLMDVIHPAASDAWDDLSLAAKSDDQLLEYAGVGYGGQDELRFVEYCIRPGNPYDVLGTCVENPHPLDENDRNLITKGQDDPTFLISSKAPAKLERSLRWKSALMVWGGVALATVSAMVLLAEFGLM